MRIFITSIIAMAALASCSLMPVQTITRKELLTPTTYTAVDPTSYTDMMYYGADNTYDYFTRNSLRYRVLRTENAMPESGRFTFNNWQGGKLYRDCLVGAAVNSVIPGLSGTTTNTATTPATNTYQPKTQTGQNILNWLQSKSANAQ
ncbi:MAG: hypothetical protein IJ498_03515 [Akkermansia sp.]|nr:hypothetical protein [Akkermansia sp.]